MKTFYLVRVLRTLKDDGLIRVLSKYVTFGYAKNILKASNIIYYKNIQHFVGETGHPHIFG